MVPPERSPLSDLGLEEHSSVLLASPHHTELWLNGHNIYWKVARVVVPRLLSWQIVLFLVLFNSLLQSTCAVQRDGEPSLPRAAAERFRISSLLPAAR